MAKNRNTISNIPLYIVSAILIALFGIWLVTTLSLFSLRDTGSTTRTAEEAPERTEALVTEVIDGDTIVVASGHFVRLVGIDAPEKEEAFSGDAKSALADMVLKRTVLLEKDERDTDKYGRLLRYVYINDIFVNEWLVRRGYARALTIPPDTRYAEIIRAAERRARAAKAGMWQD